MREHSSRLRTLFLFNVPSNSKLMSGHSNTPKRRETESAFGLWPLLQTCSDGRLLYACELRSEGLGRKRKFKPGCNEGMLLQPPPRYAPIGVPKSGPLPPHRPVSPGLPATDTSRNLPYHLRSRRAETSTVAPSTPLSVPSTSLTGLSNWGYALGWGTPAGRP